LYISNNNNIDDNVEDHGLRVVPIEMGISYLSEDSGQILIPISEFVDKYILGSDGIAYLAQHPIFDQIIDLEDDIDIPAFCYLLPLSEHHTISNDDDLDSNIISQIWFGASGGSYSPLHHDPYHNMLAQVIGTIHGTDFNYILEGYDDVHMKAISTFACTRHRNQITSTPLMRRRA
jgi:hypothetical protein